jgi:hypothetical protein
LTELIDHIDEQISECIDGITPFGLCHLIEDDNGIYPATVAEESQKVTPDDTITILTYHRLLNGQIGEREDLSFGRKKTRQNVQRIRMVVFTELSAPESLIMDIINAMPDTFEISGYEFSNISSTIDLIQDRDAIWQTEYGEAFKMKYQKRYHIYAVEYSLEFIKCPVCETESP